MGLLIRLIGIFRRHFPQMNAIVDSHPFGECCCVAEIEFEIRQVETAVLRVAGMTIHTVQCEET